MLEFETTIIYTGKSERTSKQGTKYLLLNFLNESGQTFGSIAECHVSDDIKQLDKVKVRFGVVTGRYMNLKTLDIKKVS